MAAEAPELEKERFESRRVAIVIAVLGCAPFLPALNNEFVQLDDVLNFIENTDYRALDWASLKRILFSFQNGGVYQPLSWLTHAVDYLFWGVKPFGYLLQNLLWHALNAGLLYVLARKLYQAAVPEAARDQVRWAAAFAALFFAVHPLRVEAVAWASNRSYLVPMAFYLAAVLAYLRRHEPKAGRRWEAAAVLFFALSLWSKAIGVTLPVVLLVLDVFPLGRWQPRDGLRPAARLVLEKWPYVALALAAMAIAAVGRQEVGAMVPFSQFGISSRIGQAIFGMMFYLEKTLVPLRLAPTYPLPEHLHPWDRLCSLRTIGVASISVFVVMVRRRWPAALAAWICYFLALFPFLGFSKYGELIEIAADKWSYSAGAVVGVLAGAALLACLRNEGFPSRARARILAGTAVLLAALAALSWRQTLVWHDTERLYMHTVAVEPDVYAFRTNLMLYILLPQQRWDEAIEQGREALKVKPGYFAAKMNLALAYSGKGQFDEALELFRDLTPEDRYASDQYAHVGYIWSRKGDLEKAVDFTRVALEINPNNATAQYDLAVWLGERGLLDEAIEAFRRSLSLTPNSARAAFNLAFYLHQKGLLDEAMSYYLVTIGLDPNAANAHFNLGIALTARGRFDEASVHCQAAMRLNANHASPLCRRTP